ncbi:MAG: phosphotransferase [Oscillospiraceae bacterium]|nr:phosphotransferase [Oscillospiraceae bacterium]
MNDYSNDLLEEALGLYNFTNPKADFIRHNENITYSVTDGINKYLFRIHAEAEELDFSFYRGNFDRETLIKSEIDLLNRLLVGNKITVQCPVKNKIGEYIYRLKNGYLVTVLSWLDGETLAHLEFTKELVFQIGQMTATLHKSIDILPSLNRCYYDDEFVDKFLAELKITNELHHIPTETCDKIEKITTQLKRILKREKTNFTIVHSDMSKSNMIYNSGTISPIDFSMCGYGIPEMDLGDLVFMIGNSELEHSLFTGYESVSTHKINKDYLKICEAFGVIQYILIHHKQLYSDERFQNKIAKWSTTIFDPLL